MRKFIWDLPKERQVKFLNSWFLKRKFVMDKGLYRSIRNIFQSDSGIQLDDLEPKAQEKLIIELFYFKFENSCSNAKYVRCGKKKGYENVKFLLGEWGRLIFNLKKQRPDLLENGISICEEYIRSGCNKDYAPILHRKNDSGHYEWDNIEIMPRKAHDELTKQERQRKKEIESLDPSPAA